MSIDYIRYKNREYAIVYMIVDGRIIVLDIGIPRQPCNSDFYLLPVKPEEAREVLRTWLSRMPKLKDGIRPVLA